MAVLESVAGLHGRLSAKKHNPAHTNKLAALHVQQSASSPSRCKAIKGRGEEGLAA